ncbi:hypothetical protein [Komagataeibacter medellinensis]|uniref:Uncharacterized protein n=1 Tax=Komagataeibacter medellinensis (strain NBRC 3288 / BCRC 11682 / LMG 1693 / Kondo 51) TaxID=634177 RepID=G2I3R0_KOMMN|nr:hypothetical protein [Komagataeibacter medellinensis]BAK82757.1 hypothetical protein GLX_03450 [Komagataeibacter medellinensis NBRC 3288]
MISVAVFKVAKYFIEKKMSQTSSKKSLGEARVSLTKFITIIIAVFIERLMGVFETKVSDPTAILYPAGLAGGGHTDRALAGGVPAHGRGCRA